MANIRRIEDCYTIQSNGCWHWIRAKTPTGYGKLQWMGKLQYAHRIMYEKHIGPIPSTIEINHKCKNRSCVNPSHLELVTAKHNRRERSTSKITDAIALEIRQAATAQFKTVDAGIQNAALAKKYGVSLVTIRSILRRASWS